MKKKGFTLIELLAVIVILAIIALIATPLVLKYIEYSKEKSAKLSAQTYAEAVEKEYVSKLTNNEQMPNKEYTIKELDEIGVKVKGDKPEGENDYVVLNNGNVTEYELTINGYIIKYKDGDVTIESDENDDSDSDMISTLDYTVTFFLEDKLYQIITITKGQTVLAPNTLPVKEGFEFDGWRDKDGNVLSFPILPNENMVISGGFKEIVLLSDQLYIALNINQDTYRYMNLAVTQDGLTIHVSFCKNAPETKAGWFFLGQMGTIYGGVITLSNPVDVSDPSNIVSAIISNKGSLSASSPHNSIDNGYPYIFTNHTAILTNNSYTVKQI